MCLSLEILLLLHFTSAGTAARKWRAVKPTGRHLEEDLRPLPFLIWMQRSLFPYRFAYSTYSPLYIFTLLTYKLDPWTLASFRIHKHSRYAYLPKICCIIPVFNLPDFREDSTTWGYFNLLDIWYRGILDKFLDLDYLESIQKRVSIFL